MQIDITPPTQDTYQWRILYRDGTVTDEYDHERPDGRGWAERADKLAQEVRLMTWDAFADREHRVSLPEGATPVFFRRRSITFSPLSEEQQRTTVHCIGWTRGDEGMYLFVWDDGSTLLTTDFQAI